MSPSNSEPALPEYPDHTAAFGHLMRLSRLPQAQNLVKATELDISLLMKVRDDELVLLHRIGIDHHSSPDLEVSRRTIDVEVARRNIAASIQSSRAIGLLQVSIQELRKATVEASDRTRDAIKDLENSVDLTTSEVSDLQRTVEQQLHRTTQAASLATTEAISKLDASIAELRASTETWSRWLTRLTIGIFGLTTILVIVTLAPVWR
jgi:hypothetical protein